MTKLILATVCWLMLGVALWADSSSSAKGVIVLTSASGLDPRNVLFSDLLWTDFDGGTVIASDGQKSVFAKKDIGKIVYFDSHYYAQVDNDQQERAFRAGIQAREVVVNTSFLNLDAINDLKSLKDGQSTLESLAHEYPLIQSLLQPKIDILKDDIGKLSGGQSLLDGKWMSQQEAATQTTPQVVGEINKPITFTAKDGKKYVNARVSITNTGLSVITSDGGASVSFDQLPDDLSVFPDSLRRLISGKRQTVPSPHYAEPPSIAPTIMGTSKPVISATKGENETLNDASTSMKTPTTGTQEPLPADLEEARSFIERQLGQSFVGSVSPIGEKPTVRIEQKTGHIYINNYFGSQDCLLESLDPNSIVEENTDEGVALVIHTRNHERTVRYPSKSNGYIDRFELLAVPQEERVAKAFSYLINSYSVNYGESGETTESNDLRAKLCKELRAALSSSDVEKFSVSYDKPTETVTYEYIEQGAYIEICLPIKKIDPQGIKWAQSGMNRSKLILVTIDDKPAFQQEQDYAVKDHYLLNSLDINFPTENDASEFADTITQLCKELGWQPSKF